MHSVIVKKVATHLIVASAAAWLSHLLLDAFYNHGKRLAIYWPLNEERLALPISWFCNLRVDGIFCMHNSKVAAFEGLIDQIGETAGAVWHTLLEHEQLSITRLTKSVNAPRDRVMQAVGWLVGWRVKIIFR